MSGRLKGSCKEAAARAILVAIIVAAGAFAPAGAQCADIQVFTAGTGLPSGWVIALASATDGKLWAVYRYKGGEMTSLPDGLPPVNIFAVASSRDSSFVGTSRGLVVYSNGRKPTLSPGVTGRTGVFSLATRGETLFAGTIAGLAKISGDSVVILNESDGLPSSKVLSVVAGKGFVAAGTPGGLAVIRNWRNFLV